MSNRGAINKPQFYYGTSIFNKEKFYIAYDDTMPSGYIWTKDKHRAIYITEDQQGHFERQVPYVTFEPVEEAKLDEFQQHQKDNWN